MQVTETESISRSPVLEQLSRLCRANPTSAKWVFVPSRQVGHNLGLALARSGCGWVNLEFVTPLEFAERVAGPRLAAQRHQRLSEDARLLIIDELLEQALALDPYSPFAAIARANALSGAFASTLSSLRMAGIAPDELAARLNSEKGRFVARLFALFVGRLNEERLLDDAAIFERGIAALDESAAPPGGVYAILDETAVPGVAGRFVFRAAGNWLVRLGSAAGPPPPAHSAAARFELTQRMEQTTSGGMSARHCQLRKAVGAEHEVREVLREIVVRGIPLDEVEVAYTSERPYLHLLVALADRFELDFTFASGVPAALTRPGQALAGFLRWIGSGLAASELVAVSVSGLLDPILPSDGEHALRGHEMARVIRSARIRRGREQYARQLTTTEEAILAGLSGAPKGVQPRLVRLTHNAVRHLLELCPEDTGCTYGEMTGAASSFLKQFARVSSERDVIAIESLQERLAQIGTAPVAPAATRKVALRLLDLLEPHKIGASAVRPGAVHVAPISRSGYSGRPHLFVVGLDERSFPGVPTEDPLLLDEERERVSDDLNLLRSAHTEQIWHLERILDTVSSPVVFSARYGVADAREVHASAFFQQLSLGSKEARHLPLIPPAGTALDETELMLAVRAIPEFATQVAVRYPNLSAGYRALETRKKPGYTPYHGWLGAPLPPELVPGGSEPISVSRLEALAACPYRYFLQYVLGVRAPDSPEDDPSRWLSAAESGRLLHELFRGFMEEMQRRGEKPDPSTHEPIMLSMLDDLVARYATSIPFDNESAFRADTGRMRRAARIFLRAEAGRKATPLGFEVSFGEGCSGGLHRSEPVEIILSDRVRLLLRGRIDRVDRVDDGYHLWDYKTGSASSYRDSDLLDGGRRLQWALYALAFDTMVRDAGLTGNVTESGYYFPGERGNGIRIGSRPPTHAELEAVLAPLIEMVSTGALLHVQAKNGCRFCDFSSVCSGEVVLAKTLRDAFTDDPASIPEELPFRAGLLRWTGIREVAV